MIVSKKEMLLTEQNSELTTEQLMEKASSACSEAISLLIKKDTDILIVCGKGNNGGDGLGIARLLSKGRCRVYMAQGLPVTDAARKNYDKLNPSVFVPEEQLDQAIRDADVIIDCIFGFSYHGELREPIRSLLRKLNTADAVKYSIDINSGCECDSGWCDPDAFRSDITFALEHFKPFHMLNKEHHMFRECRVLNMDLPHLPSYSFTEMNEILFFSLLKKKTPESYKNSFGQIMMIGGSYGMAGALCLNLLGAQTTGAPYVHVVLQDSIYAIAAARFLTPVYHPFKENPCMVIHSLIPKVKALCYGSGCVHFPDKEEVLKEILAHAKCPVVLDAEALRILNRQERLLSGCPCDVVVTPHIGEFSEMTGKSVTEIQRDKIAIACSYSVKNNVIVVLKGTHTIVASPDGRCYINQSGCQALAQAGSGDLLTGIITGMLLFQNDTFRAVCMSVWLHGYLSEPHMHNHAMQNFSLEEFPSIMSELYRRHGL